MQTAKPKLQFDTWVDGRWAGTALGETIQDARAMCERAWGSFTQPHQIVLTPHYGHGTADATYEAMLGKKPIA